MAVADQRRSCPFSLQFLVALAVAGTLYAQRILDTWGERTESELVALCLVTPNPAAKPAQLLTDLEKDDFVRHGRVVQPGEVASWVSEVARGAAATTTTAATTATLPAAVEVTFRGSVRDPELFAHAIGAARRHPVCGRLFFDEAARERAANFYARARTALRAGFLIALIAAFAAVAAAVRRQTSEALSTRHLSTGILMEPPAAARDAVRAWAGAFGRAVGPTAAGWLCPFAILSLWPVPLPDGLDLATHAIVLVVTAVVVELLIRCARATARHFA